MYTSKPIPALTPTNSGDPPLFEYITGNPHDKASITTFGQGSKYLIFIYA